MVTSYETGIIAAGESAAIIHSRFHKKGTQVLPVVYCHHATGHARTLMPTPGSVETDYSLRKIVDRLASFGHPTIGTTQVSGNSWGAPPVESRIDGAITRIGSFIGCRTDKVLLLFDSMGGIPALNWARRNPTKVVALAGAIPATNLQQLHDSGPTPIPANIESAYGGLAAYNAARTNYNPQENMGAYIGMPIHLWYHTDDPTILPVQTKAFATTTGCAITSMGPGGHEIHDSDPLSEIADFLILHAQYEAQHR